jgi:hypothetical protein
MAQTVYQAKLLRDTVMVLMVQGLIRYCPAGQERERSQGGILAGGDFRASENTTATPLYVVTRITLLL